MPPLESDFILGPQKSNISVALEPMPNALNSLVMLNSVDDLSGLGDWVVRTAASLSPERRHINRLVFEGMFYAVQPDRRWPSFPAYINGLAALPAETLRERLLVGSSMPHGDRAPAKQPAEAAELVAALESVDAYLAFLHRYFPAEAINVALETDVYHLILEPAKMQALIVEHMREMWQLLAPEWERAKPMLQEAVSAFQSHDFTKQSPFEAAQLICGHDLQPWWEKLFTKTQQIFFVPSAHNGPYMSKVISDQYLWIFFGARLPDGAQLGSSALNRSELLVRLGALTDDTRLQILALLSQSEELCAQDIMNQLDLSQSAASRHLRQLSAIGYLAVRWRGGEKCYTLSRERIGNTFRALEQFLAQP
jgi:ArsR family transcriptional regulator, arsenate/arsenite/antimonite-responsive transcriptional repressor